MNDDDNDGFFSNGDDDDGSGWDETEILNPDDQPLPFDDNEVKYGDFIKDDENEVDKSSNNDALLLPGVMRPDISADGGARRERCWTCPDCGAYLS